MLDPKYIQKVIFSTLQDGEVVEVFRNRWWVTINDEPIAYRGSVQCNADKSIAEMMQKMYPDSKLKFIEVAYVPYDSPDAAFL